MIYPSLAECKIFLFVCKFRFVKSLPTDFSFQEKNKVLKLEKNKFVKNYIYKCGKFASSKKLDVSGQNPVHKISGNWKISLVKNSLL